MDKIRLKMPFDYIEVFNHWLCLRMQPPEYKFTSFIELSTETQKAELAYQLKVFLATPREAKKKYKITMLKSYGFTVLQLIYNSNTVGTYNEMVLHEIKRQLEDYFFVKGSFKFPPRQLSI